MLGIGVYLGIIGTLTARMFSRPSVILSLIFLLFALDQWGAARAGGYLPSGAFTNYLVAGLTILAVIILFLYGKPHRLLGGPAFWMVLALFIYAFASIAWVTVPDKALEIWSVNFQYLVIFLIAAPLLLQDVDDLKEAMLALLLLGTPLLFCFNFLLEWGYRGYYVNGELVRLPLALAQYGGYMMIVGALFGPKHSYWLLLRLAAIALGLLLIVKTGARGQFISAMLCCGVMFGLGRAYFSPVRLILVTAVASVVLAAAYAGAITYMKSVPELQGTAARWSIDRLFEDYGERSIRVLRIEAMVDAWSDNPGTMLLGLGNSASYDPDITGCTSLIGCYPHNLPVEILTEQGIVGFGIFAILMLYIVVVAVRTISDPTISDEDKGPLKVMFAFMIFEVILSLKQSSLLGNWRMFLFAILVDRSASLLTQPVEVVDQAAATPKSWKPDRNATTQDRTRAWLEKRQVSRGWTGRPSTR
jgi:O-antigen ligase